MMVTTRSLVDNYLRELDRALHDLPARRRREIVEEIREHIAEASGSSAGEPDEAEIRTILEQVGDPETIAEEARQRFGVTTQRAGALEGFAIALLLVGGIVLPVVGWIVGVVVLWVSRAWSTRQKILGTLVVPGGLALPLYLSMFAVGTVTETCEVTEISRRGGGTMGSQICSAESWGLWGYGLVAVLALAPIAVAIYLGRRARHPNQAVLG